MKLLLTSDIHINNLNHVDIVKLIVQTAIANNADLILIAGDMFDSNEAISRLNNSVKSELEKFPNIIYIIPGNHDSSLANSFSLSNGVIVAEPSIFELDDEYDLLAIPYIDKVSFIDLKVEDKLPKKNEKKTIAMLHGTIYDSEYFVNADKKYFPVSIKGIWNEQYDYTISGHYHKAFTLSEIINQTKRYIINPGSPRLTKNSDLGVRKVVLVDTEKKDPVDIPLLVEFNHEIIVRINLLNTERDCINLIQNAISLIDYSREYLVYLNLIIKVVGHSSVNIENVIKATYDIQNFKSHVFDISIENINPKLLEDTAFASLISGMRQRFPDNESECEQFTLSILSGIMAKGK